ncbi:helix-turn-helix domain-containing protein [Candidatus Xianfuyuplasma coldseepsis]|uniref:Helix-turn-helix transcriptional regulator n=1 Tax=Candidatus Xianfuyuplasma coldseepsis TaxID=2782163 RepID=A0A7L7KTW1_9MOLU|nr:helix-turn-helix transcriptional regulator [Xianfuyuplasma coldseepsis]QMS85696.1 helix-turn-helix transcriptional regulator [Xianfuyuplasma coldseepsis]
MNNIGEMLRKIRDEKGFPQKVIAEHLGVHRTNYSRIENNIQKLTPEQIVLFCEFCDVSADYLLGVSVQNKEVYSVQTMEEITKKADEIKALIKR